MDKVRVKREELLKIVETNRETHREIFIEAQKGFREEVIKQLDARLKDARDGKRINLLFTLPAPIDQTKDYDLAIQMLKMSVDDIVELDSMAFAQLVNDDWHWKQSFMAVNSTYSATARAAQQ